MYKNNLSQSIHACLSGLLIIQRKLLLHIILHEICYKVINTFLTKMAITQHNYNLA